MRQLLLLISVVLLTGCGKTSNPIPDPALLLWYDEPAEVWEASLPLGNGRLGMMPTGQIYEDRLILNDISMWSGSMDSTQWRDDAIDFLPQIRQELLKGNNKLAQELMYTHFSAGGKGSNYGNGKDAPYGSFQLLGMLEMQHQLPDGDVLEYQRRLDLKHAIATTEFKLGGVSYRRSYFASHGVEDVLVIRLEADKSKQISLSSTLSRTENATIEVSDGLITMYGQLPDGFGTNKGVTYKTTAQFYPRGGRMTVENGCIRIDKADEVLILVGNETSLLPYQSSFETVSYNTLLKRHIEAYSEKFDRVTLTLGDEHISKETTDVRLAQFQQDMDPAFAALYFHYGRYLMISGTRPGSLPLNLQGLWADAVQSPWNGDYHLNINVQMNYWPAEVCGLADHHKPLIELTKGLVESGEQTAKTYYDAEGWVAHMMTNPWRYTAPGEHASWGATNTGGAWLAQHLWEHFAFSKDMSYLAEVYPVLEGAAQFFLSSLVQEPKNGWLVTAPSSSPENGFKMANGDAPIYVCMGPTMDNQLLRELFTNLIAASELLDIESPVVARARETLPLLAPHQISQEGYLMEWLKDYEEIELHHRHVSHLYGLYPGNQISTYHTPELADAARKTLERRGDGGTGWSRAWKVNFWARLKNGERALNLLKSLLEPAIVNGERLGGGTYPNLFCAHPPFQIDGNFGGTAGIAEMLVQSQDGFIELLPALPESWSEGQLTGFRVRDGVTVDMQWKDGQVTEAVFYTDLPAVETKLKCSNRNYIRGITVTKGKELRLTDF